MYLGRYSLILMFSNLFPTFNNILSTFCIKIQNIFNKFTRSNPSYNIKTIYGSIELIPFYLPGLVDWKRLHKLKFNTPAYGIWKLNHQYSRNYLYIVVLNASDLKDNQDLLKGDEHNNLRNIIELKLKNYLKQNINKKSHIVLLIWMQKVITRKRRKIQLKGRKYINIAKVINCKDFIIYNFNSKELVRDSDFIAMSVIYELIDYLMTNSRFWFYSTKGDNWEDTVNNTDIKVLLNKFMEEYINKNRINKETYKNSKGRKY